jgi:hypothetical protein
MLSQSLSDFYPWDSASALTNQHLLVLDSDSGTGEFAFNAILLKLVKQLQQSQSQLTKKSNSTGNNISGRDGVCECRESIVLVACNHSRLHYEYILRKYVSACVCLRVVWLKYVCACAIFGGLSWN